MSSAEEKIFLMSADELLKLDDQSQQIMQKTDLLLRDHYIGLHELHGQTHALTCSTHSSATAISTFIEGLFDSSSLVKEKIALKQADVQNLASMVLLLAELKLSLEQGNIYLELQ